MILGFFITLCLPFSALSQKHQKRTIVTAYIGARGSYSVLLRVLAVFSSLASATCPFDMSSWQSKYSGFTMVYIGKVSNALFSFFAGTEKVCVCVLTIC